MWFTIFGLAVGILVGMYIQPVISGDSIYEQVEKFERVLYTVQKNYVDDVDTPELVEAAIDGMLARLDPHSIYIPAEQQKRVEEDFRGNFEGIGVEFDVIRDTITIVSPITGGPSEALGITAGDKIVKIDGQNAVGMPREDVPKKLRGRKGTHVKVTIVRAGVREPLTFDIVRDKIPLYTVDAAFVDQTGTAYMAINRFAEPTYTEMMENLQRLSQQGMKRLILDLRGNSGGYMDRAVAMADEFIGGGHRIVFTKNDRDHIEDVFPSESGQKYEQLPLIVLIDRGSASASEILSGAVQDLDRGLIVGETSYGKGLVQRQFSLDDGSAFRVTVARYYTPSGRLIQRPYDEGHDAYFRNDRRGELSEGENTDHSKDRTDTARPRYRTASGRTVLGGGGITPDYIVKLDTLTPTSIDIISKNLIWLYVESFMSRNGPALRSKYENDFQSFLNSWEISDQAFADFIAMAKQKGVTIDERQLAADRGHLKNRLKSRIARAIWGNNEFYQVALQDDHQFKKALQLFPEASRISKLTQR